MSIVSQSGFAEPFEPPKNYSTVGDMAPALHGFRYTHSDAPDRHVALMDCLIGGEAMNLSPSAGFPAIDVDDGKLVVGFQDRTPSGNEFHYNVAHSLIDLPSAERFQIRQVGCVDHHKIQLPRRVFSRSRFFARENRVLGITGFRIFMSGTRDIELKAIGVWFEDNELNVEFRDRGGNVTYNCAVDFVSIPTRGLVSKTDLHQGSDSSNGNVDITTIDRAEAFLSGWRFEFKDNIDRNIKDIGVLQSERRLNVFFGDSGGGETFDWKVWRSQIAPQVLAPVNG